MIVESGARLGAAARATAPLAHSHEHRLRQRGVVSKDNLSCCSRFTIQIQIQIGSLHTRLDETDEMTNTGGIPAGPFLGARTTRAPRDAGGPPFVLSARTKPRIKGGELQ